MTDRPGVIRDSRHRLTVYLAGDMGEISEASAYHRHRDADRPEVPADRKRRRIKPRDLVIAAAHRSGLSIATIAEGVGMSRAGVWEVIRKVKAIVRED